MNDYLSVVYNEQRRPATGYPAQLAAQLASMFDLRPGQSLLEPGCGRGEMLKCFRDLGLDVRGNDLAESSKALSPDLDIEICDIENDGMPYPDDAFDIVYSKSLLEHFYYPERYIRECFRVLKPGGLLLNLVPDWEANYRKYFDDYTHRTPFTSVSMRDILLIHGFEQVGVVKFRQLPVVWKYPVLNIPCGLIAPFIPHRTRNKLRWVRELMLIGNGRKPDGETR
ncbi:MAG: methyltransferase [Rhodospirillaceae bacterium]|nr:methyltransferase [Rhodospirillaceae bacterium]